DRGGHAVDRAARLAALPAVLGGPRVGERGVVVDQAVGVDLRIQRVDPVEDRPGHVDRRQVAVAVGLRQLVGTQPGDLVVLHRSLPDDGSRPRRCGRRAARSGAKWRRSARCTTLADLDFGTADSRYDRRGSAHMARIAVGGMQHEANTFAPSKADYAAFEDGGGWPGVQVGDPLFDAVAGANIPVQGAIGAPRAAGHSLVPLAWAAASPSAHVTVDAFERIVGALTERLRAALPVDGVYLDLHGAMVTEHHDDGEGEILRRVREIV